MKSQSLLPLHLLSVHVSPYILPQGFPGRSDGQELAWGAGDPGQSLVRKIPPAAEQPHPSTAAAEALEPALRNKGSHCR